MTKTQAIRIFGSVPELAAAIGITRHAVYQWPDTLPQSTADRVVGAALRMGRDIPSLPKGEKQGDRKAERRRVSDRREEQEPLPETFADRREGERREAPRRFEDKGAA